jgi:hypothetical protein
VAAGALPDLTRNYPRLSSTNFINVDFTWAHISDQPSTAYLLTLTFETPVRPIDPVKTGFAFNPPLAPTAAKP